MGWLDEDPIAEAPAPAAEASVPNLGAEATPFDAPSATPNVGAGGWLDTDPVAPSTPNVGASATPFTPPTSQPEPEASPETGGSWLDTDPLPAVEPINFGADASARPVEPSGGDDGGDNNVYGRGYSAIEEVGKSFESIGRGIDRMRRGDIGGGAFEAGVMGVGGAIGRGLGVPSEVVRRGLGTATELAGVASEGERGVSPLSWFSGDQRNAQVRRLIDENSTWQDRAEAAFDLYANNIGALSGMPILGPVGPLAARAAFNVGRSALTEGLPAAQQNIVNAVNASRQYRPELAAGMPAGAGRNVAGFTYDVLADPVNLLGLGVPGFGAGALSRAAAAGTKIPLSGQAVLRPWAAADRVVNAPFEAVARRFGTPVAAGAGLGLIAGGVSGATNREFMDRPLQPIFAITPPETHDAIRFFAPILAGAALGATLRIPIGSTVAWTKTGELGRTGRSLSAPTSASVLAEGVRHTEELNALLINAARLTSDNPVVMNTKAVGALGELIAAGRKATPAERVALAAKSGVDLPPEVFARRENVIGLNAYIDAFEKYMGPETVGKKLSLQTIAERGIQVKEVMNRVMRDMGEENAFQKLNQLVVDNLTARVGRTQAPWQSPVTRYFALQNHLDLDIAVNGRTPRQLIVEELRKGGRQNDKAVSMISDPAVVAYYRDAVNGDRLLSFSLVDSTYNEIAAAMQKIERAAARVKWGADLPDRPMPLDKSFIKANDMALVKLANDSKTLISPFWLTYRPQYHFNNAVTNTIVGLLVTRGEALSYLRSDARVRARELRGMPDVPAWVGERQWGGLREELSDAQLQVPSAPERMFLAPGGPKRPLVEAGKKAVDTPLGIFDLSRHFDFFKEDYWRDVIYTTQFVNRWDRAMLDDLTRLGKGRGMTDRGAALWARQQLNQMTKDGVQAWERGQAKPHWTDYLDLTGVDSLLRPQLQDYLRKFATVDEALANADEFGDEWLRRVMRYDERYSSSAIGPYGPQRPVGGSVPPDVPPAPRPSPNGTGPKPAPAGAASSLQEELFGTPTPVATAPATATRTRFEVREETRPDGKRQFVVWDRQKGEEANRFWDRDHAENYARKANTPTAIDPDVYRPSKQTTPSAPASAELVAPAPAAPKPFTPDYATDPYKERPLPDELAVPYEKRQYELTPLPKETTDAIRDPDNQPTPKSAKEVARLLERVKVQEFNQYNWYTDVSARVTTLFGKDPNAPIKPPADYNRGYVNAILQEHSDFANAVRRGDMAAFYDEVAGLLRQQGRRELRDTPSRLVADLEVLKAIGNDTRRTGLERGMLYQVAFNYFRQGANYLPLPVPKTSPRQTVLVPRLEAEAIGRMLKRAGTPEQKRTAYQAVIDRYQGVTREGRPVDVGIQEPIHPVTIKDREGLSYTVLLTDDLKAQFDAAKTLKAKRELLGLDQPLRGPGRYNEDIGQVGHVTPQENVGYGGPLPMTFTPEGSFERIPTRGGALRTPWAPGVKPVEVDWRSRMAQPETPVITASEAVEYAARRKPATVADDGTLVSNTPAVSPGAAMEAAGIADEAPNPNPVTKAGVELGMAQQQANAVDAVRAGAVEQTSGVKAAIAALNDDTYSAASQKQLRDIVSQLRAARDKLEEAVANAGTYAKNEKDAAKAKAQAQKKLDQLTAIQNASIKDKSIGKITDIRDAIAALDTIEGAAYTKPFAQFAEETIGTQYEQMDRATHRASVEQALQRGRTVPPEVLDEYPELAPRSQGAGGPIPRAARTIDGGGGRAGTELWGSRGLNEAARAETGATIARADEINTPFPIPGKSVAESLTDLKGRVTAKGRVVDALARKTDEALDKFKPNIDEYRARELMRQFPDPINPAVQYRDMDGLPYVGPVFRSPEDGRLYAGVGGKQITQGFEWAYEAPTSQFVYNAQAEERRLAARMAVSDAKQAIADLPAQGDLRFAVTPQERRQLLTGVGDRARFGALNDSRAAVFGYDDRTIGDYLLSAIAPYPYWAIRHMVQQGRIVATHPGMYAAYLSIIHSWYQDGKNQPPANKWSLYVATMPDGTMVRFRPQALLPYATGSAFSVVSKGEAGKYRDLDWFEQLEQWTGLGASLHWPWEMARQASATHAGLRGGPFPTGDNADRARNLIAHTQLVQQLSGGKWDAEAPLRQLLYGTTEMSANTTGAVTELAQQVRDGKITSEQATRALLSYREGQPNDLWSQAFEAGMRRQALTNTVPRFLGAPIASQSAEKQTLDRLQATYGQMRDVGASSKEISQFLRQNPDLPLKWSADDDPRLLRLGLETDAYYRESDQITAKYRQQLSDLSDALLNKQITPAQWYQSRSDINVNKRAEQDALKAKYPNADVDGTGRKALQAEIAAAKPRGGTGGSTDTPARLAQMELEAKQKALVNDYFDLGDQFRREDGSFDSKGYRAAQDAYLAGLSPEDRAYVLAEVKKNQTPADVLFEQTTKYKPGISPERAAYLDKVNEIYTAARYAPGGTAAAGRNALARAGINPQAYSEYLDARNPAYQAYFAREGSGGTTTSRSTAAGAGTGRAAGASGARGSTADRAATQALWNTYNAIADTATKRQFLADNFDAMYAFTAKDKIPAKPDPERTRLANERTAILNRMPPANDKAGRARFFDENAATLNRLNEQLGISTRYNVTQAQSVRTTTPVRSGGGSIRSGGGPRPPLHNLPAKAGFEPPMPKEKPRPGYRWVWRRRPDGSIYWEQIPEGQAA